MPARVSRYSVVRARSIAAIRLKRAGQLPAAQVAARRAALAANNHDDSLPSTVTGPTSPLNEDEDDLVHNPSTDTPRPEHPKNATPRTSFYWETPPPTPEQLKQASTFFHRHPPTLLFSSSKFRLVHPSPLPEVAFLGRSNVGKSTLLNALTASNTFRTSSKPGRTKTMNFFALGGDGTQQGRPPGKLVVVDMPGYGKGSREEWGPEIMKYLVERKQLRRAFLLLDPLHGLKRQDAEILAFFRQRGVSHQVVLSKADRIVYRKGDSPAKLEKGFAALDEIYKNVRGVIQPGTKEGPEALGEVIAVSADPVGKGKRFGVDELRWAVLAATGMAEGVGAARKRRVGEVRTEELLVPRGQRSMDELGG